MMTVKSLKCLILMICFIAPVQADDALEKLIDEVNHRASALQADANPMPSITIDQSIIDQLKQRAQHPALQTQVNQLSREARANASQFQSPLLFDNQDKVETVNQPEQRQGRLYVFISESVPLPTLREYARQLEKTQAGVMVLNGFVDGIKKIKPTMTFLQSILKKDKDCDALDCAIRRVEINVNPILFSKYQITHVPAFVWDPMPPESFCDDDNKPLPEHERFVLQGAADLYYIMETMNQHRPNARLATILEGHYQ